jgi:hypothetical protein
MASISCRWMSCSAAAAGHRHRMRGQDRLSELYFSRTDFGVVARARPAGSAPRRPPRRTARCRRRAASQQPTAEVVLEVGARRELRGSAGRPAPSNSSWACDSAVSTVLTCPSSHPSTFAAFRRQPA